MKAALLITEGFEEAEAVIVYDILCRLDVDVDVISCTDLRILTVDAYFSLSVNAGKHIDNARLTLYDAVIIPGGPASTEDMSRAPKVIEFIQQHDLREKWICALCSAPARVLGQNYLLHDRNYTCSGELWQTCPDGKYTGENIVVDGNLITGKGLGVAFEFAFTIAEAMTRESNKIQKQKEHIYFTR
ncbi:DJ-1/PfpI family protein [Serratia sp. 1D1416]|uniref:DJ-1/PfpI family protein n=1 Tax=Serratia sp. 1D1416 TaxID=2447890 RepID=UPI001013C72A|nr:DJ-1/PfpI family protein [Serratia sp. 1D1416]